MHHEDESPAPQVFEKRHRFSTGLTFSHGPPDPALGVGNRPFRGLIKLVDSGHSGMLIRLDPPDGSLAIIPRGEKLDAVEDDRVSIGARAILRRANELLFVARSRVGTHDVAEPTTVL